MNLNFALNLNESVLLSPWISTILLVLVSKAGSSLQYYHKLSIVYE